MAPKKRAREEEAIAPAVDPLLDSTLPSISVSQVLPAAEAFGSAPWAKLQGDFAARAASAAARKATWYLHARTEDLLLNPDGLRGQHVPCIVVVATEAASLAPAHYICRTPLPHSDAEDNTPEQVVKINSGKFFWRAIHADGEGGVFLNAYLLSSKADVRREMERKNQATAAPAVSFGFGAATTAADAAPAAAPISFGLTAAAPAFGAGFGTAPAAAPAFGFGTAAPASAAPSFGFGAVATAATTAAPIAFGFGATAAAGSVAPVAGFATTATAAPAAQEKVEDLCFVLWSAKKVKSLVADLKSGSKVILEDFKLPSSGKAIKLVVQDDVKEKPDKAAKEILLKRVFARDNALVQRYDAFLESLPMVESASMEALQDGRAKLLAAESTTSNSAAYQQLLAANAAPIAAALTAAFDARQAVRAQQLGELATIEQLLKAGQLAPKEAWRIAKYYPTNAAIDFRPSNKVTGLTESGEHAHDCFPPAYVWKNPFFK